MSHAGRRIASTAAAAAAVALPVAAAGSPHADTLPPVGSPPVGGLPVVGSLTGQQAANGGSASMPTSAESVPMQAAQHVAAPAPAAVAHPAAQAAAQGQQATTDAAKLTTHYVAKHKKA